MDQFIDAHIHMWDKETYDYPWPTPDLAKIFRSFHPNHLKEALDSVSAVQKVVFIQVNQTYEENDWILNIANHNDVIAGVVGWVDLQDPELDKVLDKYTQYKKFRGVRNILEGEADDWLGKQMVHRGLGMLEERGLTFDLLVRTRHLLLADSVAKKFPKLKLVVDHIAKPSIKEGIMNGWKEGMTRLAQNPNVFCKLSGMVTEADHQKWVVEDLKPYIEHVLSVFGPSRCMFGSDWPVCTMAATYKQTVEALRECTKHLNDSEQRAIFRDNVVKFYGLDISSLSTKDLQKRIIDIN